MTLKPRAGRRHDRWRMVQKAVRVMQIWDGPKRTALNARGLSVYHSPHAPEQLADNLAICSCWICRHRRPTEGPTLRERRFADT